MTLCNVLSEKQAAKRADIDLKIFVFLRIKHPELFFFNRDEDGLYWYCSCCIDRDAEELQELRDGIVENDWLDEVEAVWTAP